MKLYEKTMTSHDHAHGSERDNFYPQLMNISSAPKFIKRFYKVFKDTDKNTRVQSKFSCKFYIINKP